MHVCGYELGMLRAYKENFSPLMTLVAGPAVMRCSAAHYLTGALCPKPERSLGSSWAG